MTTSSTDPQAGLEFVASWTERQMILDFERMLARVQISEADATRWRASTTTFIAAVRVVICAGDLEETMSLLGNDSGLWVGVLELAGPLVAPEQLAASLSWGWTGSRQRVPAGRLLPLFHAATALRATVPADWPDVVTIYRGATAKNERSSRRRMRELAWTTNRLVAAWFAGRFQAADRLPFVGTATVNRDRILAAYLDSDESECVIDPADLAGLTVAPLTAEDLAEARAWKTAVDEQTQKDFEAARNTART